MNDKGRFWKMASDDVSNPASGAKSIVARAASGATDRARRVGALAGEAASDVCDAAALEIRDDPLVVPWRMGFGQMLRTHPQMPASLSPVIGQLDRLGRLEIAPHGVGFDGEVAAWSSIAEIVAGPASDILTSVALDREVGRITALLPRVPGRRWAVRQATGVLAALCLVAAGRESVGETPASLVPHSIRYRSGLRTKTLTPGIFATLVMATNPLTFDAISRAASVHAFVVTSAPPSKARDRAERLRAAASSLQRRMQRDENAT